MYRKLGSRLLAALFILLATSAAADNIITGSKPYTFIPGTVISSSQVNANFDYIINQTNTNAAKNGANSSITALLGLTTPIAPNFGGSSIYTSGVAGGTVNAITVSSTQPAISGYTLTAGNFVLFLGSGTNTSTTTLDVNATGATVINKTTSSGLSVLTGGEIIGGLATLVYYDGTRYVLMNQYQLFGAETTIASASTTDLALAGGHNASITGTTGITSFGSNASLTLPIYYAKFTGALTITFNGTSLITPNGGNILTAANDSMWVEYLGSGNWRIRDYIKAAKTPTVQRLTSGTGATYTPGVGISYIRVRMTGGGGGGAAQTANNGAVGTTTVFGSWTAIFGNGGTTGVAGAGGVGGTGGATGTGVLITRIDGANGSRGGGLAGTSGGNGGETPFGGGGTGGDGGAGLPAKANTGSGGGGGEETSSGGAGEYVEFYVTNPAATTYTVGAGGNGGAAGTTAGGNGAAGIILIEENYN